MDCLIRFVQLHETFRKPEIQALATLADVNVDFLVYTEQVRFRRLADEARTTYYSSKSPYSIIRLEDEAAARTLISRSISSKAIYELWGSGASYEELHLDVSRRTSSQWHLYRSSSFRFEFDTFHGSRPLPEQMNIIDSFKYLGFSGLIKMRDAEQIFTIFEEYEYGGTVPRRIYLARLLAPSQRLALQKYSLKKREYINTTSMDSELALLTANIALAASGKMFYDPFVGTGSFPIACSHFGAMTIGSDIDARMVRGRDGKDIRTNFRQYYLLDKYLDGFISDLTHSPFRGGRFLDGIICDPPYGVREGLKVLGTKGGGGKEAVYINGEAAHLYAFHVCFVRSIRC